MKKSRLLGAAAGLLLLTSQIAHSGNITLQGSWEATFAASAPMPILSAEWTYSFDTETLPVTGTNLAGDVFQGDSVSPDTFQMTPTSFPNTFPDSEGVTHVVPVTFDTTNVQLDVQLANGSLINLGMQDVPFSELASFSTFYHYNNGNKNLLLDQVIYDLFVDGVRSDFFISTDASGSLTYTESDILNVAPTVSSEFLGGADFGGIDISFDEGFTGEVTVNPFLDTAGFSPTFSLPGGASQAWDIDLVGDFSGSAELSFSYDESALSVAESDLVIYHYLEAEDLWVALPSIVDEDNNIITGITDGFSPFVIGVAEVPVPAAVWLFGSGLVGLIGIARRKKAA